MTKPVDPGSVAVVVAPERSTLTRLGYALTSLPIIVIVVLMVVGQGFMDPLFTVPPEILGLPVGLLLLAFAALWAVAGMVVVRVTRSAAGIALAVVAFTFPSLVMVLYLPAVILIIQNLNY